MRDGRRTTTLAASLWSRDLALARTARLLALLQALRRYRRPVTAHRLAAELGVSPRTIYRDIATLFTQGAPIEGGAGIGYVLRPGFLLPPLMFGADEVDALLLGLRFASRRGDPDLARGAENALAKIVAVLPPDMADVEETSGLLAGASAAPPSPHLGALRAAIRNERRALLRYADGRGHATERIVWPVAIGFFETTDVLAAWCELRKAFRHFRLDRIVAAEITQDRMPRRRRLLLAEWRLHEKVDDGY